MSVANFIKSNAVGEFSEFAIQFEMKNKVKQRKHREILEILARASISPENAVSELEKEFDTVNLTQFENARAINS